MRTDETSDLRWVLGVVRRWAWLIIGCALLSLIVALFVTARVPPTYEATTTLLAAPAEETGTNEYNTLMAGERLALTYVQLLKGRSTLEGAIARLGLKETSDSLAKRVRTTAFQDTQLIGVTVSDTSPARAAAVANTIADVFTEYAKALRQDRYQAELTDKGAKVKTQRKAIDDTQAQIATISAKKIADDTELARLERLLNNYRETNQVLQTRYESLRLAADESQNQGAQPPAAPSASRLADVQAEIAAMLTLIDKTEAEVGVRTASKLQNEAELVRLEDILAQARSDYRGLQQDYEQLLRAANEAPGTIVIAERAQEPRAPVGGRVQYAFLAVVVAVLGALGGAFVFEYLEESVKTPEDVRRTLGLNTLGLIGQFDQEPDEAIAGTQAWSPAGEAFRALGINVRLSSMDRRLRAILVTSPSPDEGKSVVVANLAIAMASARVRVIVVDADLRRPRQHELFGLSQGQGLTYALWQGDFEGYVRASAVDGVSVLTSGSPPQDPVAALSSPRLKMLIDELAQQADLLIIDSPPVLPLADATILAAEVDGILLVLRAGRTGSQSARRALTALRQTKAVLLGAVLNGVPAHRDSYYRYYSASDERPTGRSSRQKRAGGLLTRRLPGHNGSRHETAPGSEDGSTSPKEHARS